MTLQEQRWEPTRTPGLMKRVGPRGTRYKVKYRDATGKQVTQNFDRLKYAETFAADLRVRKARGALPDTSQGRRKMAELWEHFRTTSRARPSTMAWYESRWIKHVEPALGSRRIAEVRRSELEELYADVEKRTSIATRRAVQQLVHKLFAVALRSEWIQRNPADGIDMPAAQPRDARFLTEDEVRRIADEVPSRYRALVWTLAIAGLRIGEAAALRVKNLDGSIRIVENSVEVGGMKVIGRPKTAGSDRVVPIPETLRTMLREHVSTYGNAFDPESFVFTTERRAQIGQGVWRKRVFQPAAVRANVRPTPRVHDLRHTAASLMLADGFSTFEVAKVLGHSSIAMVEKLYGHLYEDELQKKMDGRRRMVSGAS